MGKSFIDLIGFKKTGLLNQRDIKKALSEDELIIRPLLDDNQIGEIAIDLRIGIDFLSSNQGRDSYFDATEDEINKRPLRSHFSETRRKIGETFLFNPGQTILFSTLEYIKLPTNVFGILSVRSSYSRLGLSVSTIIQPGYCGCISVEITNPGKIPIKIMCGARFVQIRLYRLKSSSNYFHTQRKYACQVRPVASKANEDKELSVLRKMVE
jgi:dCTP deaminase